MSASASRAEIMAYIDDLLDVAAYGDYCVNGLQVEGTTEITRIVAGVSSSRELFDEAGTAGADLVLVHHGLFWGPGVQSVREPLRGRLYDLLSRDINLAAYHLPLDGHLELGNNAIIARELGLEIDSQRFANAKGTDVGVVATASAPMALSDLTSRLADITGHDGSPRDPLHIGAWPETVHRVAICSGGGGGFVAEAVEVGAEVLITGEADEPTMADAREAGIAVLCGGHYATEVFGIRELARVVADRFDLPWAFHLITNPV